MPLKSSYISKYSEYYLRYVYTRIGKRTWSLISTVVLKHGERRDFKFWRHVDRVIFLPLSLSIAAWPIFKTTSPTDIAVNL